MKIAGRKIEGLNKEEIIIPRGNGDPIVFIAEAIPTFDEFDILCPKPKPRIAKHADGTVRELVGDPTYVQYSKDHATRRFEYMIVKSLLATPELEWETIKLDDPSTWKNYRDELFASGFSEAEVGRLITGVMSACGLDESKVEKARQNFLATRQAELERKIFQEEELKITPSGNLVKDLE